MLAEPLPFERRDARTPTAVAASAGSRIAGRPATPLTTPGTTCVVRCCSSCQAPSTMIAPLTSGLSHWLSLSCCCVFATSDGVPGPGSVAPRTGTSPAAAILRLSAALHTAVPSAAPVASVLIAVERPTPSWVATRCESVSSRPAPPTTWAATAAALTGAQRDQPAVEARARCRGSSSSAAAAFRLVAPMREPPNQAAAPASCRKWMKVCDTWTSGPGGPPVRPAGTVPYPSRPRSDRTSGDRARSRTSSRLGDHPAEHR